MNWIGLDDEEYTYLSEVWRRAGPFIRGFSPDQFDGIEEKLEELKDGDGRCEIYT